MSRLFLLLGAVALIGGYVAGRADARTAPFSAYSGACDGQGNRTADGSRTRWGVAAANRNNLPMHTLIRLDQPIDIPGHKPRRYFRVRDTGGPLMNRRIDIWFPNCQLMLWWGVRTRSFQIRR